MNTNFGGTTFIHEDQDALLDYLNFDDVEDTDTSSSFDLASIDEDELYDEMVFADDSDQNEMLTAFQEGKLTDMLEYGICSTDDFDTPFPSDDEESAAQYEEKLLKVKRLSEMLLNKDEVEALQLQLTLEKQAEEQHHQQQEKEQQHHQQQESHKKLGDGEKENASAAATLSDEMKKKVSEDKNLQDGVNMAYRPDYHQHYPHEYPAGYEFRYPQRITPIPSPSPSGEFTRQMTPSSSSTFIIDPKLAMMEAAEDAEDEAEDLSSLNDDEEDDDFRSRFSPEEEEDDDEQDNEDDDESSSSNDGDDDDDTEDPSSDENTPTKHSPSIIKKSAHNSNSNSRSVLSSSLRNGRQSRLKSTRSHENSVKTMNLRSSSSSMANSAQIPRKVGRPQTKKPLSKGRPKQQQQQPQQLQTPKPNNHDDEDSEDIEIDIENIDGNDIEFLMPVKKLKRTYSHIEEHSDDDDDDDDTDGSTLEEQLRFSNSNGHLPSLTARPSHPSSHNHTLSPSTSFGRQRRGRAPSTSFVSPSSPPSVAPSVSGSVKRGSKAGRGRKVLPVFLSSSNSSSASSRASSPIRASIPTPPPPPPVVATLPPPPAPTTSVSRQTLRVVNFISAPNRKLTKIEETLTFQIKHLLPTDKLPPVVKAIQNAAGLANVKKAVSSSKPDIELAEEFVIDLSYVPIPKLLVINDFVSSLISSKGSKGQHSPSTSSSSNNSSPLSSPGIFAAPSNSPFIPKTPSSSSSPSSNASASSSPMSPSSDDVDVMSPPPTPFFHPVPSSHFPTIPTIPTKAVTQFMLTGDDKDLLLNSTKAPNTRTRNRQAPNPIPIQPTNQNQITKGQIPTKLQFQDQNHLRNAQTLQSNPGQNPHQSPNQNPNQPNQTNQTKHKENEMALTSSNPQHGATARPLVKSYSPYPTATTIGPNSNSASSSHGGHHLKKKVRQEVNPDDEEIDIVGI